MAQPPNLLQGPEPVETAELHFKLCCKLKVFETQEKLQEGHCSVLAVSQYYGLLFVGNKTGFSVIKTKSLKSSADFDKFPKRDVNLNSEPTHFAVDSTQKILAVVYGSKSSGVLAFYNIQSFGQKDISPLKITPVSSLVQNLALDIVDITWQPVPEGSLVVCFSDGSVVSLSHGANDGPVLTLPSTTQAMCFCWSPKGKQIVIGSAMGTLSQYKPDLKLVKTLPAPTLFKGNCMVVSVLWISSFQFAVGYNDRANPESFPVITIVNAAKNEPVNVINYDDITYSSTLFRNHQIYMNHQNAWNLIFVSSANSIEVAVLHSKDGSSWEQWLLGDASRAELPLNSDRQETFPLGCAFDFTSQEGIPWGEGTLPPMPRLLLVSDEGLLCVFNIVNTSQNAPQLCSPPKENIDDSMFVVTNQAVAPPLISEPPKPAEPAKSIQKAAPTFGSTSSTFTFQANTGLGGLEVSKPPAAVTTIAAPTLQFQSAQPQQQSAALVQTQQTQPSYSFGQASLSINTFKPPTQFGASFSFGAKPDSTSIQTSKPVSETSSLQPSTHQETSFALKPSAPQVNIFAGKNLPQSTPLKQSETVDKTVVSLTSAVEKTEKSAENEKKQQKVLTQEPTVPETPKAPVVDDSVYLNALQEEIDHFNSELQQLTAKVGKLNVTVGSEEDKFKMKKTIDNFYDFWKELKDTTEGQSGEVHAVVMDLMEAFAWLEDAKSRNLQRKNPSYIELKKSEELDPLSARHMSEIGHLRYYIENQLKQLTSYLEKEWLEHQENFRKEVKNKMNTPPLEEVYKTMHFQLKILNKQRALIEELKEKIADKKRKNKSHNFASPISHVTPIQKSENRYSELSKLAENLLQLKIKQDDNTSQLGSWEMMKSQLKIISERSKKLSRDKQSALRDVLSECAMVKIRPVKTNIESSSFLRSLALASEKTSQPQPQVKPDESKTLTSNISTVNKNKNIQKFEVKAKPEGEKSTYMDKTDTQKIVNATPDKPLIPASVQSTTEEKSPLAYLSGFVSSISKPSETKTQTAFVFGNTRFQKLEPAKESLGSSKTEPKPVESNMTSTFSFGSAKTNESNFNKKESVAPGSKSAFEIQGLTFTTKSEISKTAPAASVSIIPVIATTATSVIKPFTFSAAPNSSSSSLPKMNLVFSEKEQNAFANVTTTSSFSAVSFTSSQTPSSNIFNTAAPIFGVSTKSTTNTFTTSTTSLFGVPKTTAELPAQNTGFTFTQFGEKSSSPKNAVPAATIKPTAETEEVDVLKVDEPSKPPQVSADKPKESLNSVTTGFISSTLSKTSDKNDTASPPPNISITPQTSITASTLFSKLTATTEAASTTENSAVSSTVTLNSTIKTTTPPSVFSFSTAGSLATFGQTTISTTSTSNTTTTTVTATTSVNVCSSPSKLTTVFGQVSSTTPTTTTSIFGGSSSAPTSNIFSGSTATKSIFGQTGTQNSVSGSIFGNSNSTNISFGQTNSSTAASTFGQTVSPSTPTTFGQGIAPSTPTTFGQGVTPSTPTTFGQGISPSTPTTFGQGITPSTPTTFGQGITVSNPQSFTQGITPTTSTTFSQKPDAVSQTANLFGQMLSDSNRSIFGSPTTTPSTTNLFSSQKSLFGGSTNTTTASLFGSGTSTTTASIFGGGTSTTTASIFGGGASVFQKSTSIFGSPTSTANVFGQSQNPTTTSFFNQNICSPFGSGASVTSSQTTFESGSFNKPLFGQSTFGQPTNSTNIFGGSSGGSIFGGGSSTTSSNVFQMSTTSSSFTPAPGPFSGGASTFGESSFGSSQKPLGGFGSPPVFGSAPAFAGSPTFGGPPGFGSLPTFGSTTQATFGQTSSSSTFENLANQNTVGFGNLAQQSQNSSFGGGFGSSPPFENKPAFGGNSFSSWRSK